MVGLVDMVVVPEARQANALSVAVLAEPPCRWSVEGGVTIAAQKCYGIAFDQTAAGVGTGIITDVQPQKRHLTDILTNERLDIRLRSVDSAAVNV